MAQSRSSRGDVVVYDREGRIRGGMMAVVAAEAVHPSPSPPRGERRWMISTASSHPFFLRRFATNGTQILVNKEPRRTTRDAVVLHDVWGETDPEVRAGLASSSVTAPPAAGWRPQIPTSRSTSSATASRRAATATQPGKGRERATPSDRAIAALRSRARGGANQSVRRALSASSLAVAAAYSSTSSTITSSALRTRSSIPTTCPTGVRWTTLAASG